MLVLTIPAGWSADDLNLLPDDGNRYEVVGGELFVTPSPRREHQLLHAELFARLHQFVRANQIGHVFSAPGDVHFDAKNCVQPDIFVEPRSATGRPASWRDAPKPILVVEILAENSAQRDLGAKRDLYRRAGIAEYWIVDSESRAVHIVRPCETDAIDHDRIQWRPASTAHALTIDLPALFRDALDE